MTGVHIVASVLDDDDGGVGAEGTSGLLNSGFPCSSCPAKLYACECMNADLVKYMDGFIHSCM